MIPTPYNSKVSAIFSSYITESGVCRHMHPTQSSIPFQDFSSSDRSATESRLGFSASSAPLARVLRGGDCPLSGLPDRCLFSGLFRRGLAPDSSPDLFGELRLPFVSGPFSSLLFQRERASTNCGVHTSSPFSISSYSKVVTPPISKLDCLVRASSAIRAAEPSFAPRSWQKLRI